jgi:hypothetical protein
MRAAKAPRVPVLENAFEVNLSKLMRAARATGSSTLVLDDGEVQTVAMLTEARLAVFLGDKPWVVDIVPVPERQPFKWRRRHLQLAIRLAQLTAVQHGAVREWLERQ